MPDLVWYDVPVLLGFSAAQLWTFVSPIIAGAAGAWLTRWYRQRDDREARRREYVAGKLQEAYHSVCDALEYPGMDPKEAFDRKLKLEKAFNTIDLYADSKTRMKAREIAEAFARGQTWITYEPLLTALRDRFRESMGLEHLSDPVQTLKFGAVNVTPATSASGLSESSPEQPKRS